MEIEVLDELGIPNPKKRRWSDEETELLKYAVGTKWKRIVAEYFPTKPKHQVEQEWQVILTEEPHLVSYVFLRTAAEINLIKEVAHLKNEGMTWREIQKAYFPNRSMEFVHKIGNELSVVGPFKRFPVRPRQQWKWNCSSRELKSMAANGRGSQQNIFLGEQVMFAGITGQCW